MTLSLPLSHFPSSNELHSLSLHSFPISSFKPRWPRMDSGTISTSPSATLRHNTNHRLKDKIVVIMGATGSGKSGLSIDLSSRFPSEIINSDKMQVYKGLNITTNKIPLHERLGVPHHLLGEIDPLDGEFTPSEFRTRAGDLVSDITSRNKLPLIVGGSNSFIHALVVDCFDPNSDAFNGSESDSVADELRYRCCFLWVDVYFPVLSDYLSKRVDDMIESGMVDELAEFYDPEKAESEVRTGLRKAIGVPEFDRYLNKYPPEEGRDRSWDPVRRGAYEEAVRAIKKSTNRLAEIQMGKIQRLREGGWDLKRVDATAAFAAVMTSETENKKWKEIWERQVVEPSVKIVKGFLEE